MSTLGPAPSTASRAGILQTTGWSQILFLCLIGHNWCMSTEAANQRRGGGGATAAKRCEKEESMNFSYLGVYDVLKCVFMDTKSVYMNKHFNRLFLSV